MMRKVHLWGEFLSLFVAVPLIYYFVGNGLPKVPLLLGVFGLCLIYLLQRQSFDPKELVHSLRGHSEELKWIFLRSLLVAVGCMAVVMVINPDLLFGFPRARPLLWLMVMGLYPLLSAYPQEVIYRAFFFQRYGEILPTQTMLCIASTFAFSFLHIIFGNWIAVILTIPAGYLFTRTYMRTGSLLLAAIEHGLYGCIVFTSGLGRFFYMPPS